ncbi:hypothetical protein FH972_014230 [Carpinus fangiana]|uniref:DUF4408 domain-containing protein n=1 Tax=Carpinus fangiana TaxID=176857 RepID=A0A5N6R9B2_9ROSI|nr:hypothetical protein FH972_014230 [Carpinus fangiana]
MGNFRHPYIQIASQFNHFCNPNKAIRFFLSFSVLSITFSFLPFLIHSFHVHISTFPMKLFSYTVDKNYMFLLCNGLLVLIVKNSGLVGKSPFGDDLTEEHVMKKEDSRLSVPQLSENKAMDGSENVLMDVEEEKEMAELSLVPVGNGDEGEEEGNGLIIIENEEDEEGEEPELISAEELQKRCDDFIRRMKEGIKIESRS